ncbi:MAG: hypothetical protein V3U59_04145, partial [Gammaproteobacteria bacterium]
MKTLVLFAGLLIGTSATAQIDSGGVVPPVEGEPVQVQAGIYVVDIANINEVNNTFHVEMDMIATWNDPRLAFDRVEAGSDRRVLLGTESAKFLERLWSPNMVPENAIGPYNMIRLKTTIFSDGKITLEARLAITLSAILDYRRFPFDKQILPIRIGSFAWNIDQMVLSELPGQTAIKPDFTLPEWSIGNIEVIHTEVSKPRADVPYSRLT